MISHSLNFLGNFTNYVTLNQDEQSRWGTFQNTIGKATYHLFVCVLNDLKRYRHDYCRPTSLLNGNVATTEDVASIIQNFYHPNGKNRVDEKNVALSFISLLKGYKAKTQGDFLDY